MIAGLIIDLFVVVVIGTFGWAGAQLGGIASIGRFITSLVAFGVAALLRDPVGAAVRGLLGTSTDFSRLVGMLVVGVGVFLAGVAMFRWWTSRRDAVRQQRLAELIGEDPVGYAPTSSGVVGGPRIGALFGALLGMAWALVFATVVLLAPVNNVITRGAVQSVTGGALIDHESLVRWFVDGFPHYTQTLPKGAKGVSIGERRSLPMHGKYEIVARPAEADPILHAINRLRSRDRVQALVFNPRVAEVAERHAKSLAAEQTLSHDAIGGGSLAPRVQAALGGTSGAFGDEVDVVVAWAHTAEHFTNGLVEDRRAEALVSDPQQTEVGIGVADAGWFDGRIYVLILVGEEPGQALQPEQ